MTKRRNDGLAQNGRLDASPLLHAVVLRFLPATSVGHPTEGKRAEQMRQYCHFIPILEPPLPVGIIGKGVFGVGKWMKPYIWQARL